VDAEDPAAISKANAVQDKIKVEQASRGKLEVPNWDQKSQDRRTPFHDTLPNFLCFWAETYTIQRFGEIYGVAQPSLVTDSEARSGLLTISSAASFTCLELWWYRDECTRRMIVVNMHTTDGLLIHRGLFCPSLGLTPSRTACSCSRLFPSNLAATMRLARPVACQAR
jgi:hypothetical protein